MTTGIDAPNIERHAEVEEQNENTLPMALRRLQDHNNGLRETDHPVSIVEQPEVTKVLDAYIPQSDFYLNCSLSSTWIARMSES